jgi:NAD(P)-dependent dehydrogenase (short-subunit alcohol dehydrogenase family)
MTECRFDGRVALVTGSGGGLGRQHALELARRGAKVMINDIGRDGEPTAQYLADELIGEGLGAAFDTGSVAVEAEATALVAHTIDTFGRIDILVNNAGAGGPGTALDVTTEAFADTITLHLFGSLWTMRAALPHMRAQNYGRIINTSSQSARSAPRTPSATPPPRQGSLGSRSPQPSTTTTATSRSTPSARLQRPRWRSNSSTQCRTSAGHVYTPHVSHPQCCSLPTTTAP